MFLARKRIALSRVEGHEAGLQEGEVRGRVEGLQEGEVKGREAGRAEAEAEYEPIIREMQERIRELEGRNDKPDA